VSLLAFPLRSHKHVFSDNHPQHSEQVVTFPSNNVVTAKYTVVTFLPKFLFEVFMKLANFYFLVVSVLQTVKIISNTDGQPSTAPVLMFIVGVEAAFQVMEDRRRHRADSDANGASCNVFNRMAGKFEKKQWREIVVGDLIKVLARDNIPADMLMLATKEDEGAVPLGIAYVETKSLDGETNLKLRQAFEPGVPHFYPGGKVGPDADKRIDAAVGALQLHVTCEFPNDAVNKFTGAADVSAQSPSGGGGGGGEATGRGSMESGFRNVGAAERESTGSGSEPVQFKNILLRGCTLRNTEWVVGMVVSTGPDTKIMMSMGATPTKMSSIERDVNKQVVWLVLVLTAVCLAGAVAETVWLAGDAYTQAAYLMPESLPGYQFVISFFYYFLLMYQFIPVSLYVSMSTVKYLQSYFIEQDREVHHVETDTPALVRNMTLNEELGQVSHIFSDKTGTLTCNIMDFRKCSIRGVSYGHGTARKASLPPHRTSRRCHPRPRPRPRPPLHTTPCPPPPPQAPPRSALQPCGVRVSSRRRTTCLRTERLRRPRCRTSTSSGRSCTRR
jgi:magnesium-transporting ATPase (P-type)